MRTSKVLVALVIVAVALPLVTALAGHVTVRDKNDTSGALDVRTVRVTGKSPPRWTVLTWRRWSLKGVWDRGYVAIYFDTFGSLVRGEERYDYYALLYSNGAAMQGRLFRDYASRPDGMLARLPTWRPSRASVKVRIPVRKRMRIGASRFVYKWYVQTILTGKSCTRVCFDRAPNTGGVSEPVRPSPTPPPSPSPSPSVVPTPSLTPP